MNVQRLDLVALALLTAAGAAQEKPRAFVGARLVLATGAEVPRGTLVVAGGSIAAVGPEDAVVIPAGAERLDVTGKVIMPGLVCSHSHIGGAAGGDKSHPIQPECRVLDALDVRDAGFAKARAGGITTVNVMSGSGHLISGQTAYLKLRRATRIEDMVVRNADGSAAGGLKMANGTNSIGKPPFPGTRAKSAALVRAILIKAREYGEKLAAAGQDATKRPARDLQLEALLEALQQKRVVHFHTHRHDDIVSVLRLREEFGFRVVLHHVSEGYKVADRIAAAGVPCSVILIDSPGGKLEAADLSLETGAVLERAGVPFGYHTDDGITDSRFFLRMAALGVRAGLSRQKAVEALTIANARMLDLGERVGTLEAGKDADFVVLSGDPFSVYTKVEQTWIEGAKVFDRADPRDRLAAEGGDGASRPQVVYMCCFGQGG
jgi:imidazolonepropionase-like amidohydrolase